MSRRSDYLTLDQVIAKIDAVTTEALHDNTIVALEDRRDQLVTDQQVSATEVIAASSTLGDRHAQPA